MLKIPSAVSIDDDDDDDDVDDNNNNNNDNDNNCNGNNKRHIINIMAQMMWMLEVFISVLITFTAILSQFYCLVLSPMRALGL